MAVTFNPPRFVWVKVSATFTGEVSVAGTVVRNSNPSPGDAVTEDAADAFVVALLTSTVTIVGIGVVDVLVPFVVVFDLLVAVVLEWLLPPQAASVTATVSASAGKVRRTPPILDTRGMIAVGGL